MTNPKVRLFALFTGVAPEAPLPAAAWRFWLSALLCTRQLMAANWRLLLQAWPSPRGAPLPLPAVMDLLANVFNAELPTSLPVRASRAAALERNVSWRATAPALSVLRQTCRHGRRSARLSVTPSTQ